MKSTRVNIRYAAQYLYPRAVSFSPHLLRLFPRSEPGRLVRSLRFTTNAGADVQFRRDALDNNVARVFLPEAAHALQLSLDCELDLRSEDAFHFLLDAHAAQFPFVYSSRELLRLAPYLAELPPAEIALPLEFWRPPAAGTGTVDLLMALVSALNREIRYETRDDGPALTPQETLLRGSGACRDTARLLRSVLYGLGLASRLVSGYLWEPRDGTPSEKKRADGAFHAWTEVYLPGAGWLGLDGTNGVFCDHHFIACAVGIDADDITPILGRFFASDPVIATMQATLEINETS